MKKSLFLLYFFCGILSQVYLAQFLLLCLITKFNSSQRTWKKATHLMDAVRSMSSAWIKSLISHEVMISLSGPSYSQPLICHRKAVKGSEPPLLPHYTTASRNSLPFYNFLFYLSQMYLYVHKNMINLLLLFLLFINFFLHKLFPLNNFDIIKQLF